MHGAFSISLPAMHSYSSQFQVCKHLQVLGAGVTCPCVGELSKMLNYLTAASERHKSMFLHVLVETEICSHMYLLKLKSVHTC